MMWYKEKVLLLYILSEEELGLMRKDLANSVKRGSLMIWFKLKNSSMMGSGFQAC